MEHYYEENEHDEIPNHVSRSIWDSASINFEQIKLLNLSFKSIICTVSCTVLYRRASLALNYSPRTKSQSLESQDIYNVGSCDQTYWTFFVKYILNIYTSTQVKITTKNGGQWASFCATVHLIWLFCTVNVSCI